MFYLQLSKTLYKEFGYLPKLDYYMVGSVWYNQKLLDGYLKHET